jgi:lincosamide nucleotidyltransferase
VIIFIARVFILKIGSKGDCMPSPQQLLHRLDEIGDSLSRTNKAQALIGLGSAGVETTRLDEYSDLDFFGIVKEGYKPDFIRDLTWLSSIHPIAWYFQNTPDGYKLLFEDGIFAEFAIFELWELEHIPYAPGRLVWAEEGFALDVVKPKIETPTREAQPVEWLVGEALSNLYIGLCRYRRGEKLSAFRFVQVFAVDRLLELASILGPEKPVYPDPFANERRFEKRFPGFSKELPGFMLGYERTQESALNILGFIDEHFKIDQRMKMAIFTLAQ